MRPPSPTSDSCTYCKLRHTTATWRLYQGSFKVVRASMPDPSMLKEKQRCNMQLIWDIRRSLRICYNKELMSMPPAQNRRDLRRYSQPSSDAITNWSNFCCSTGRRSTNSHRRWVAIQHYPLPLQ